MSTRIKLALAVIETIAAWLEHEASRAGFDDQVILAWCAEGIRSIKKQAKQQHDDRARAMRAVFKKHEDGE